MNFIYVPLVSMSLVASLILTPYTQYSLFEDGSGTVTTAQGVTKFCLPDYGCTVGTDDTEATLTADGIKINIDAQHYTLLPIPTEFE